MNKFIVIFAVQTLFVSCNFHGTNAPQNNWHKSCDYAKTDTSDNIDVNKLMQNKWYCIVGPDCVSYITFHQDFKYEEENCEWGLLFNGNYEISNDSIILYEYDLDSNSPDENEIVNTQIYTYVYQGDRIKLVNNKTIKDGAVVNIYFPDSIFYYRFDD